jgi:hypothetical protein
MSTSTEMAEDRPKGQFAASPSTDGEQIVVSRTFVFILLQIPVGIELCSCVSGFAEMKQFRLVDDKILEPFDVDPGGLNGIIMAVENAGCLF